MNTLEIWPGSCTSVTQLNTSEIISNTWKQITIFQQVCYVWVTNNIVHFSISKHNYFQFYKVGRIFSLWITTVDFESELWLTKIMIRSYKPRCMQETISTTYITHWNNENEKNGQEKLRTFYIIPWWRSVYHSVFGWTFTLIDKMNFFKANKKEMEKRKKEKPAKDQKKTFHLSCWNHVEHWTLMLRSIKHVTKRHKMSYSIQFSIQNVLNFTHGKDHLA